MSRPQDPSFPSPPSDPAEPSAASERRPTTLAWQATLSLGAVALLCVALLCLGGYLYVLEAGQGAALDRLRGFLLQQRVIEGRVFESARTNALVFRGAFLRLYREGPMVLEEEFADWFLQDDAGAWRTHRRHFEGTFHSHGYHEALSGFVSNVETDLSADHKRRLVLSLRLLAQLGPAWDKDFVNTAVSTPENGMVLYWPGIPWGLQARADLVPTSGSVIRATFPEENPDRTEVWTGLYHDHTAQQWMITYEMPIDDQGRHLVNIGHDVPLDDLLERLETEALPGADRFLLHPEGRLIAWPGPRGLLEKEAGEMELADLGDTDLIRRHRLLVGEAGRKPQDLVWLVEDRVGQAWVGATKLEGPGWWYVVSYPKDLVTAAAHRAARIVLVFGGVLSLLLGVGVQMVMQRRVGLPLRALTNAAEAVRDGRLASVASGRPRLPEEARNEIGLLARSFRAMALRIHEQETILEREIAHRTRDLEIANRRLRALSETDGLTGLRNRRALDTDLAGLKGRRREDGPLALILCDIDHFKAYNDTFGHQAGDDVLRKVAERLMATVRPGDAVYRYGGEEIAVLLTASPQDAQVVAQRMVDDVAALDIPHSKSPYGVVTLSAGLAVETVEDRVLDQEEGDGDEAGAASTALVQRADRNLYAAKDGGRNRLVADSAEARSAGGGAGEA